MQKSNAHTEARSDLFESRKMTPKSNLPEGRVKFNFFQPAAIAQNYIALAIATSKSTKITKSAPDCRRAYYGAMPRARAFSECAQNPSVSIATPRILDAGHDNAPRASFDTLCRGSAPRDVCHAC